MKSWYSNIYKAFIFASMLSFIIGFFTSSKTSLGAYIAGYSTMILAVMMILIILFNNIIGSEAIFSLKLLGSIFINTGPFILMLAVLSFILYLMIFYYNSIIEGRVATNYTSFSNIIILLLLIQNYLVYNNITTEKFEAMHKLSKVTTSLIYLIGVITGICSVILYTILKYYSTDGFANR